MFLHLVTGWFILFALMNEEGSNNQTEDGKMYLVNRFNIETMKWETIESKERVFAEALKLTPEVLTILIEGNTVNRKLYQGTVEKHIRSMLSDDFTCGDSAICVDNEHGIRNGQHRMWAGIESNTTQLYLVKWGATQADQEHYDSDIRPRSLYDVGVLSKRNVTPFGTSVARYLRRQTIQYIPKRATRGEELDFCDQHQEGLEWVESIFRPKDFKKTQRTPDNVTKGNDVASAFVRAWYFYKNDLEKQARVELMAKGLIELEVYSALLARRNEGDGAFARLINYMAEHNGQGQTGRDQRYAKTEKAILQFVNRENKLLVASDHELFLLKVEIEAKIMAKSACVSVEQQESEKVVTLTPQIEAVA